MKKIYIDDFDTNENKSDDLDKKIQRLIDKYSKHAVVDRGIYQSYKCHFKISIPGKTFEQVKVEVEKALCYPEIDTTASIKYAIQQKLEYYCRYYTRKNNLSMTFPACIVNYEEREGCMEIDFNTIIIIISVIGTIEATKTIAAELAKEFAKYLVRKLKERIDPNGESNCKIEGTCEEKDYETPTSEG